ncbi:Eisosome component PIL1-domain-containing protein [Gilbertella persicaria]|uniref:Eisosome component PIL1-domain-containing protein n=1 Tax=Gilbertella persicaria TaxID=101096 RepID=UPI00221EB85E|nr:Eisosome component PIL1-domain-containing protein [Gilbertella persicaria]KAI8068119.1 Eisosome component PIL1-domain-containing protein [Gilbertella persicaria]
MFSLFHKSSEKSSSEKGLSNVLEYTQKSSRDISQLADNNRMAANNLMAYGSHMGDDLTDVTHKLGQLLTTWSNILMEFSDAVHQYQDTLKSISLKEEALQPSREQKRKLNESIERLQGSYASMDKMNALKTQLRELEAFTEPDEVEMTNFKRIATREGLYLLLNGMHAMASKTDIISTFGKYIVDELDVAPIQPGQVRPPYEAMNKTKRIQEDAIRAIEAWHPDKTKVRRTLTSHHGHNPLVVKELPPLPVDPEENRQYSFYKPDEEAVDQQERTEQEEEEQEKKQVQEDHAHSHPMTPAGLSSVYPHHAYQPPFNQHNLYQFYQHYLPPRSYEDMSMAFSPGAVFRGIEEQEQEKHDAGGFVLPSDNPNNKFK